MRGSREPDTRTGRSRRGPGAAGLVVLLLAGTALPCHAQSPTDAPTPGLEALAFMTGCWEEAATDGGPDETVIEERYGPPSDNVMLGTTRFLRGTRTVQFELTVITAGPSGVELLPYPGGTPAEHPFRLVEAGEGRARFEAPMHDFPKRIGYRRSGDRLTAWIDGGADDPEPISWEMRRTPCDASLSGG